MTHMRGVEHNRPSLFASLPGAPKGWVQTPILEKRGFSIPDPLSQELVILCRGLGRSLLFLQIYFPQSFSVAIPAEPRGEKIFYFL